MRITQKDKIEAGKVVKAFDGEKTEEEIFYNLCFAILAPQTTFKSNIKVTKQLTEMGFYKNDIDMPLLQEIVRPTRFFRQKTYRLLKAKQQFDEILDVVLGPEDSFVKRNKLVKMVNGIGMKAGSHFLRNLGHTDLAIIDTHVLKYLGRSMPKNKREYLEIENEFAKLAKDKGLTSAELDAIVWKKYSDTSWEDFEY